MGFIRRPTWIASLALLAATSLAQANPLNLLLEDAPDVTSGFISVSYDATSDAYLAQGFALTVELPPEEPPPDFNIDNGTFDISLAIDGNGDLLPAGGSLVIGGMVGDIGAGSPLLTGTAVAFGWFDSPGSGNDLFEFIFEVTGGSLVMANGYTMGSQVGVVMGAGATFSGNWETNFSNSSDGNSDTAPLVPEPASLAMLLLGSAAMLKRRRLA